MSDRSLSYKTGPAIDQIIDPFERWAKTGYAEGVVDFLPSLSREPLLLSPSSLLKVFDTAFYGFEDVELTDEDKEEFSKRIDFIEALIDDLMTRERNIRDRYYSSRKRGMIHRTAVLLGGIGLFTAATVSLPTWASIATGVILLLAGSVLYMHFSRIVSGRSSAELYDGRAARVITALPWIDCDPGSIVHSV